MLDSRSRAAPAYAIRVQIFVLLAGVLLWGWSDVRQPQGATFSQLNQEAGTSQSTEDPAAWGSDHVEQGLPPYVTGDECLFCHRDIGPTWGTNAHQLTIRSADANHKAIQAINKEPGIDGANITLLLGRRQAVRFLKRSTAYGKLDLMSVIYRPLSDSIERPQLNPSESTSDQVDGLREQSETGNGNRFVPGWDQETFAKRCVGCHATAVETSLQAFSAISIDCFACHGDVPLGHTTDISQVYLSKTNAIPRHVNSICGQCHLRGGKSQSTALPYPNTFVAGDNLFRDFKVDFKDAAMGELPEVDKHIFWNAREVAFGRERSMSCTSCHSVHGQNSEKHQGLEWSTICSTCHTSEQDLELSAYWRDENRFHHSKTCGY